METGNRKGRRCCLHALGLACMASTLAGNAQMPSPHADVVVAEKQMLGGELIQLTNGTLRIKPCEGETVRVTFVAGSDDS